MQNKETKEPNADLAEGKRNERPRARSNGANERTGKKKQAEKGTVTAGTRTKKTLRKRSLAIEFSNCPELVSIRFAPFFSRIRNDT